MTGNSTIRVLCVDDEPDLASLVARFLTEDEPDIDATAITSGREAIDRVDEGFDCIVCDYDMPGMDGLEVLEAVRERTEEMPFILFTGQGNEDVASEAVRAGVTDYIPKSTGTDQYELLANRVRNAVERTRARASMREVFNAATDGLLVHDRETGAVVDVNDAAVSLWGEDREAILGTVPGELCLEDTDDRGWLPSEATETGPRDWYCGLAEDSAFWAEIRVQPATIDGEERLLAIARDITNRKAREQQLSTLLSGAETLLSARSIPDLGATVTGTMTETLEFDAAALFVPRVDGYKTVATAGKFRDGTKPESVLANGRDGAATDGGRAVTAEIASQQGLMAWPLGDDEGVLVAECETADIDEFTEDLIELHVALSGAALIRSAQEQRLAAQHEELQSLNHMNEVIRDINQTLVKVSTRDEIEQLVCKQLAAASPFVSAWIGEQDLTEREVSVRVAVGRGADELRDLVIPTDDDDDPLSTIVGSVIDSFDVELIEALDAETIGEERAAMAEAHGFESITIVPITYQNALYDLLTIYAEEPHPLGPEQRAVLQELGETIGYAMHTAERSRALLSDTRVELEYQIRDRHDLIYGLSAAIEADVKLERIFFRADDSARLFLSVNETNVAAIREQVDQLHDGSATVREISRRDEHTVVEVSVSGLAMMRHLSEAAATIKSAKAEEGEGRLVIEIPTSVSVRTLTENLEAVFDEISLLARRQRDADDRPYADLEDPTDIGLTDRQHEVLLTAYHAGFFAWPRESTGEEIAELLDISQPTFHEHLRTGERKLLDLLFEHRRSVYT